LRNRDREQRERKILRDRGERERKISRTETEETEVKQERINT
jgi:hypothetical protein